MAKEAIKYLGKEEKQLTDFNENLSEKASETCLCQKHPPSILHSVISDEEMNRKNLIGLSCQNAQ